MCFLLRVGVSQRYPEKAASLPDDKRREYAERVALSLWGAMGGSDDEDESGGTADPQQ